jgi:hypothetical protein
MKEAGCEHPPTATAGPGLPAITTHRQQQVLIADRVLVEDALEGRAYIYCPVTLGPLDPVPAPRCANNGNVAKER